MAEIPFMRELLLHLGQRSDIRVWRQNSGEVIFTQRGTVYRFRTGVPVGAADISGIVLGYGWRLEIEVKARDAKGRMGKRSDKQIAWANFMQLQGAVYALVTEDDGLDGATAKIEMSIATRKEMGNA